MKPLEVWTCQRAENLKKKSSKIPKNDYAAKMVSAARRQIIGGGAPINKSRRRRRSQIVGGGGAARRRTALVHGHWSAANNSFRDRSDLNTLVTSTWTSDLNT